MNIFLEIFLILVLGYIGYQLYQKNKLKKIEIAQEQEKEIQKEDDEYLKGKYPHLFLDFREELRAYYSLLKMEKVKEEHAIETAKELKYASSFDLLGNDYDLQTNPYTMIRYLEEKNEDNKERLESLKKLEDGSVQIYQKAQKETFLTETELWFLIWKFWNIVLKNGSYTEGSKEKDKFIETGNKLKLGLFSDFLERYKKEVDKIEKEK